MTKLTLVRYGAFSGSGISLREALRKYIAVEDLDLIRDVRRPSMLLPRVAAVLETRRAEAGTSISKTAAWSRGLQRRLPPSFLSEPVLFVQSTMAFDLARDVRYAIYTDRLGLESVSSASPYRARASSHWLERERRFVLGADRLFVMGPTTKEAAVNRYGYTASRVTVVGGGPNMEVGGVRSADTCRDLLFVGVDWERKGLVDLLAAFEVASRRHPQLSLTVVGGQPPGPFPKRVMVRGRVPHQTMRELYASADALVIPTYEEAFGIALVEALMAGIPVIGSTVGNQSWIIREGGMTVPPGDVNALVSALDSLVGEYPEWKRRAEQRRESINATMTWDRIAHSMMSDFLPEVFGGAR